MGRVRLMFSFNVSLGWSSQYCVKSKETLRESEERLSLAIKSAGIGIWDWNVMTDELIWSDSMHSLFSTNQITFKNCYDSFISFLHPLDRDRVDNEIRQAIERRHEDFYCEYRIVVTIGSIRNISTKARLHYNDNQKLDRMTGVCQDITERRQAELTAEKYLSELLENNQRKDTQKTSASKN